MPTIRMKQEKARLQTLASQLTSTVNDYATNSNQQNETAKRMAIVALARNIVNEAIPPERHWQIQASALDALVASQLFQRWGAFDEIPVDGVIDSDDLARKLDADESLIRRVGRILVAAQLLRHVEPQGLAHTPKSMIYRKESHWASFLRMCFDENYFAYIHMPQYFVKTGLREPQALSHNPYSFANGQFDKSYWDILGQDPERVGTFMRAMDTTQEMMPTKGIYDYSWVRNELDRDTSRAVFVDVGGGKGHVVQAVCEENEWLPRERCIVQDRQDVVDQAERLDTPGLRGVKFMAHDFNSKQTIQGALIYHIRCCLHDYSDATCIIMLRHLANAMAPDSRLLIVEQVIDNPPSPIAAHYDMVMLTIGGKERTADEFRSLAAQVGLRVARIHQKPRLPVAVVECVRETCTSSHL